MNDPLCRALLTIGFSLCILLVSSLAVSSPSTKDRRLLHRSIELRPLPR